MSAVTEIIGLKQSKRYGFVYADIDTTAERSTNEGPLRGSEKTP